MRRLLSWIMLGLLLAAPLAACGKKGGPESDPPTLKRTYPKPDKTYPGPA